MITLMVIFRSPHCVNILLAENLAQQLCDPTGFSLYYEEPEMTILTHPYLFHACLSARQIASALAHCGCDQGIVGPSYPVRLWPHGN